MKNALSPIIACFIILTIACNTRVDDTAEKGSNETPTATTEETNASKFPGLYKLHIMEKQDTETGLWNEVGEGYQGYILYDNAGTMSVHLTPKGYEQSEIEFHSPFELDSMSIEELKHRAKSYVYFAKYTVDETNKTVEHARFSHSNPAQWDAVVTRNYSFRDDTLMLSPKEEQYATLRLKWIRITVATKNQTLKALLSPNV